MICITLERTANPSRASSLRESLCAGPPSLGPTTAWSERKKRAGWSLTPASRWGGGARGTPPPRSWACARPTRASTDGPTRPSCRRDARRKSRAAGRRARTDRRAHGDVRPRLLALRPLHEDLHPARHELAGDLRRDAGGAQLHGVALRVRRIRRSTQPAEKAPVRSFETNNFEMLDGPGFTNSTMARTSRSPTGGQPPRAGATSPASFHSRLGATTASA